MWAKGQEDLDMFSSWTNTPTSIPDNEVSMKYEIFYHCYQYYC